MSSISPKFVDGVKKWIDIDIEIEIKNKEIRDLRDAREKLEKQLIPYMINNDMNDVSFRYQSHKIYIANDNNYTNLSFTYIENKITQLLGKSRAKEIITYLKQQRNKTTSKILKRGFSKLQ